MNKKTRPQIRYSEEFKRMAVADIEADVMNIVQEISDFPSKNFTHKTDKL